MTSRSVRWEEMFPDELEAALAARPVLYLTYGLCEPHGMNAALGVDALKPHGLACAAASAHGGIVAPPFFWHVSEIGIEARWCDENIGHVNPWLTTVPPWVLYRMFLYHLRTAAARGFRAAVVISGQAPYGQDFRALSEIFMRHSPLRVWAGEDTDLVPRPDPDRTDDAHAGRYEISMMWALHPSLVDMSRYEPGRMAAGATAPEASRRHGETLVAERVTALDTLVTGLLEDWRPPSSPAQRTPGNPLGALTFDQVEAIWADEVRPILPTLEALRPLTDDERVDPDSPWAPGETARRYD